ncbi:MAG TPA: AAA family ATPase [Solirubrobacteraceae bacterium]|nr:AAA family ATPase [Solirubrobacteraceae bacterium]
MHTTVGEERLYDREGELTSIGEVFDQARGGSGGALLIEGAPGLGKSALLRAARRGAGGLQVLHGAGEELERGFAFGVARDLFARALQALDQRARRRALTGPAGHACAALGIGTGTRSVEGRVAGRAARGAPASAWPGAASGAEGGGRILHGLYCLLVNLAVRAPLALVLDDLHWVDHSSLHLLAYVIRRLEGLPVAIVMATRPPRSGRFDGLVQRLAAERSVLVHTLTPLGAEAVGSYLEDRLGGPVDVTFAETARSLSGGVPYLLEHLAPEIERRGLQTTEAEIEKLLMLSPQSLSRVINARLAELPTTARSLASAAAILGSRARLDSCIALAHLSAPDALQAIDELAALAVAHIEGEKIAISHPLLRRALLADLAPGTAVRMHLEAAEMLDRENAEPAVVAAHLLAAPVPQGSPAARSWALDLLQREAERALAQGAPADAARLLRRALIEAQEASQRATLLFKLGAAEIRAGEADAIRHLRVAARSLLDPGKRAGAHLELGLALIARGDPNGAVAVLDQALVRLGEGPAADRRLRVRLEAELLAAARIGGAKHADILQRLQRLGMPEGEGREQRLLLGVVAFEALIAGGMQVGALPLQSADAVIALARRALSGDASIEHSAHSPPLNLAAYAAAASDDLASALCFARQTLQRAEKSGSVLGFAIASCWRSHFALRAGDLRLAEEDARACLASEDAHHWRLGRPAAAANLIEALLGEGRVAEAEQLSLKFVPGELAGAGLIGLALRVAIGRVHLLCGRYREAVAVLEACGAEFDGIGARNPALSRWRSLCALALAGEEKHEQARALAAEEMGLARAFGSESAFGCALVTSALLSDSRRERRALLEEAEAVLGGCGARLDWAHALLELGALHRREGRRSTGVELLQKALDLAERLGAGMLRERARAELASAGLRPRRALLSGPESLTGAELRVAEAAAAGMTNREIAQRLYLSVKTVETHLRHAYQKLDISSRKQLPSVLTVEPAGQRAPR